MDLKIKGRTALITGGDSGMGLATAKLLAEEGVNIVMADINQQSLESAYREVAMRAAGAIIKIKVADITKKQDVTNLAGFMEREFGGVDILVNCAGGRGTAGDFLGLSDEDWYETIDLDLMGAVRVCRAFIPQMQRKGWGRIVLIASENAFQPYEDESPYNACKAGIVNLTKCLSRAYSKDGLLINCVSPAYIRTPMTDIMMQELARKRGTDVKEAIKWFLKNKRPNLEVGRRGEPEEVAAVISFLCSERASFVNGSNYRVDGGSVESAFG